MAKYKVNVTETSYRFVEVEADSEDDACEKAEDEYYNGNVIWTADEFVSRYAEEES